MTNFLWYSVELVKHVQAACVLLNFTRFLKESTSEFAEFFFVIGCLNLLIENNQASKCQAPG